MKLGGVALLFICDHTGGEGGGVARSISQSGCSIRGLTSSIIPIDLDSDRCRPRPPGAPDEEEEEEEDDFISKTNRI